MLTSERIRELWENYSPTQGIESFARAVEADAIEALEREVEELRERLAATAKSAFEAMPHDIPTRMKRQICVNADWSGSLASRAYIEIRKALTGEPYRADEDLDAAWTEIEGLRKDAERYRWLRKRHWSDTPPTIVVSNPSGLKLGVMTYSDERLDEVVDAAIQHEGASHEPHRHP